MNDWVQAHKDGIATFVMFTFFFAPLMFVIPFPLSSLPLFIMVTLYGFAVWRLVARLKTVNSKTDWNAPTYQNMGPLYKDGTANLDNAIGALWLFVVFGLAGIIFTIWSPLAFITLFL